MRIALISDLHMEFKASTPVKIDRPVDVLVLAGDIASSKKIVETAVSIANGLAGHIVFVAGNHEFYGDRVDKAKARMHEQVAFYNEYFGNEHITFLDDSYVDIDGVRFAGGTLWTDYELDGRGPFDMLQAEGYMNDHRRIKFKDGETYRRFLPKDARKLHQETRLFLHDQIMFQSAIKPLVVVTHHAPHSLSVNEKYRSNTMNSAYASDLSSLVNELGPRYWFHGHMHDPCDYMMYNTQVVANPRGYPGENESTGIRYLDL